MARRMSDALPAILGPAVEALYPWTVDPPDASAPAATTADLAAAATRPARPRWLTPAALSASAEARHGILAAMHYAESILDLVGDTPLVRIRRLTRDLGPADRQPLLLAKLEMLNPGGSVKDRIGLPMIEAAETRGPAQARRHDHRTDLGQHRPRPRHRGRAQGLSLHLRHGRQAVGREAAAPARVRRRGRPVPDQRRPRLARELLLGGGPAGARHPGRVQARPVLERGEPGRPRADDRPGAVGPDRGPDHPFRRERRDGRDDLRAPPARSRHATRRSR